MTVTIAVLTFRRPDDLAELLPALFVEAATVAPPATVLVVDNDPAGGAEPLVRRHGDQRVRYAHEPRPGIAAARNYALDTVETDLLVFIDDDERPEPGWLLRLVETWHKDHPAAVVGPVVSRFDGTMTDWVQAGQFFDRRRLPTGTLVGVAATNNLLLDLGAARRLGLRFDERFGISGGSDTLFTRQLHQGGGRMVWCDEAVVLDKVPASRLTRRWVLARAFRSGNSWARTSVALADSRTRRVIARTRMVGAGGKRILGGSAQWSLGLVRRDLEWQARGVRAVMRGAGMMSATWGFVYAEYRRAPSDRDDVEGTGS